MKKELLSIENGMAGSAGSTIFRRLYIRLFHSDSMGIVFDDAHERKRLIQFLKGDMVLNAGRINFDGQNLLPEETPKLFKKYIGIIERDKKLIRSLDIEENIFLCAADSSRFFIGSHTYTNAIAELNRQLECNLRQFPAVEHLSQKERILLEMVKSYVEGRKLIVFSNISNLLNETELDEIFAMTLKMRSLGIGFIVIETFDEIIMKWTSEFIIIKNGKTMGVFDSGTADGNKIYSILLQGEKEKEKKVPHLNELLDEEEWAPVLEFEDVSAGLLRDFNLSIGKGEVVKIYYTDDRSCSQIVDLLNGGCKPTKGTVLLSGENYTAKNMYQAVRKGVCFVEEQTEQKMLLKNMSVYENVSLLMGEKVPYFWMRPRFNKSIREFLGQYLGPEDLDKKLSGLEPVYLQQMIYYRWLIYHPQVVICIKPFSQEDIHVREITVMMIKALCDRGIAVIILTAKFSDIHRIEGENIFLRNGKTIDEDEVYQFLYSEDGSV